MVDGEHRIAYNSVLFPFDTLHGVLFPACLALLRVVFSVFCVFCGDSANCLISSDSHWTHGEYTAHRIVYI